MSIWITDTIESCIDKVIDNRGKNPKNYLTCGQYPVIDNFLIQNEKYPNLCNVTRYLDKDLFNNFLRNYLEKDDVIITLVGNGIGNVSMSPSADVAIVQNTIGLRCNNKLLNNFLYYYLLKNNKSIKALDRGGAQPSINKNDVLNSYIYYPESIDTQNKIAKVLSNYDDLIENNNKRIKILEEMAQKIYKEWFVDFKFPNHETATFKQTELGKIPSDWEIKKISKISTLSKGKSYKSSELVGEKEGLPFLNLKCVERDGGFRRDGLKWFDGKYNDTHVVMPEDIIMAVTDMTQERRLVARPARIPHNWYKEYVMSMDLVKLIANIDIDKSYFYSLLKYSNFSDEVKNHANGANVLHLNPQNIEQFELVVADKSTRDSFGNIVKQIYDEIDILYLKNETLKQTRDLLLPRLISGEIDVENMEIK